MTTAEQKALGWYATQYGLKPQLSVPPTQMHFTRRSDGKQITVHLNAIVLEYSSHKKEEAKRRARELRLERKKT